MIGDTLSEIPEALRTQVISELYRQADELDWELLSSAEKNAQYTKWIDDPAIGGILTRFREAGSARVWIKDTPMKEYARAQEGFGPFAKYAHSRYARPEDFVSRALGAPWAVVNKSVGEKPMHCTATDGSRKRYICWGRPAVFKDLVWAALTQVVKTSQKPLIIVTLRDGLTLPATEKAFQLSVANHCQLDIQHLNRTLQRTPAFGR